MDIFDLSIEEFEKQVDNLLNEMTEDELIQELIENGLEIDEYESEFYYVEDTKDNVWEDKNGTSKLKNKISMIFGKEIDLGEAA